MVTQVKIAPSGGSQWVPLLIHWCSFHSRLVLTDTHTLGTKLPLVRPQVTARYIALDRYIQLPRLSMTKCHNPYTVFLHNSLFRTWGKLTTVWWHDIESYIPPDDRIVGILTQVLMSLIHTYRSSLYQHIFIWQVHIRNIKWLPNCIYYKHFRCCWSLREICVPVSVYISIYRKLLSKNLDHQWDLKTCWKRAYRMHYAV